jgi:hypothetical protein
VKHDQFMHPNICNQVVIQKLLSSPLYCIKYSIFVSDKGPNDSDEYRIFLILGLTLILFASHAASACFGHFSWRHFLRDLMSCPADPRGFVVARQEQVQQHRKQLTALTYEHSGMRERSDHSSRDLPKPLSIDGLALPLGENTSR